MPKPDDIGHAHKIASALEAEGYDARSGGVVLAMALGILAAADPRGHRELMPLVRGFTDAAQVAFDGLREGLKNRQ